jgi:hypothetical protein
VDAFINIRGREWTDRNGVRKFFNTLEAWQVTFASIANRPEIQAPPIPQNTQPIQQQQTQQQPIQPTQQQTNYDPLGFGMGSKENDPF